jgi:hypothetical protein
MLSSSAWSSQSLSTNSNWIHILTNSEVEYICSQSFDDRNILFNSSEGNKLLNNLLLDIVDELEYRSGIFVLKNFPIYMHINDVKRMFSWFGSKIGRLLPQSSEGKLIIDVQNNNKQDGALSRGPFTNEALQFHSDRCDVTALMCIQQAEYGGETLVASSQYIHNRIYEDSQLLLEKLYTPFFYTRAGWEKEVYGKQCYLMPVFNIHKGFFASRYMRPLIDEAQQIGSIPKMTNDQLSALNLLESIANEDTTHIKLRLEPGDVLLFNNLITFHARHVYRDNNKEEGGKRHLLRLWLSTFNSRPLSDYYQPLFGNIGPGELRGGYL